MSPKFISSAKIPDQKFNNRHFANQKSIIFNAWESNYLDRSPSGPWVWFGAAEHYELWIYAKSVIADIDLIENRDWCCVGHMQPFSEEIL